MRKTLTLVVLLFAAVTQAQNVVVSANQKITPKPGIPKPGEAQSTVVPPGLKSQCLGGRFLVTNDWQRPTDQWIVTGRDLDNPAGSDVVATFDNPPGDTHLPAELAKKYLSEKKRLYPPYSFITNDHDLVVLHNGDVLYMTGAASRTYVKVPWFELSYRGDFGPGARSVVLTWRSTDCGQTFHYVGEFDPAQIGDGSCAMPQFRHDPAGNIIYDKPYDMGGADGQTVHVDPTSNRLYLTFSCVGYHARGKTFTLDRNAPLNKTLVAISDDSGASWHSLGSIDYSAWRLDAVPLSGGALGFGIANGALLAKKAGTTYSFDSSYVPASSTGGGWSAFPLKSGKQNPWFWTNIFGHTLAARTPGSDDFFIVYAATLPQGYGYRLAFYDRATSAFADADDEIVPAKAGTSNFVMHPAVIDNGSGPVLLYWNDVDLDTASVTVRGRFIFGPGSYSSDFVISRDEAGQPRSFPVKKGPPADWYGDYQTAAGFRHAINPRVSSPGALDVYYPMWIEAGGVIRFARVEMAELGASPNLRRVVIPAARWRRPEAARSLSKLQPVERLELEVREHE